MKYNHIIWDFDGTLFDSYPVMASAFSEALNQIGISKTAEAVIPHMKISMGHITQHIKETYNLGDSFFTNYKSLRKQAEIENLQPFDGVIELCCNIYKNGGKNYLFTHRGESSRYFLDKFRLTPYFADLITSTQKFPRKPSPDAIMFLMDKHGFEPSDAIMIGDRDLDILSGKNAGIHTCHFTEGGRPSGIAEININNFDDLYQVLNIDLTT